MRSRATHAVVAASDAVSLRRGRATPSVMRHARQALAASGAALLAMGGLASEAKAQDLALDDLPAVHAACRSADDEGLHDRLYSILLDAPTTLTPRPGDEEGEVLYTITDARSLRSLGGSVQLVPSHLETIAFVANPERAQQLEVARARGARVRVGFFLGFDEPERRACLVRAVQAVTAVRIDVAFVELVDVDGSVLAREDHDRLRAWSDDPERTASRQPEVTVGAATTPSGPAPDAWGRALRGAALTRQLLGCHTQGVARGASRDAMVQVRLRVDARAGRIDDAVIEVGNVGDEDENACILTALRHVELGASGTGNVDVRVPMQLRVP